MPGGPSGSSTCWSADIPDCDSLSHAGIDRFRFNDGTALDRDALAVRMALLYAAITPRVS